MGSCEWAVMGLESGAVSARVTKHLLLFLVKRNKWRYITPKHDTIWAAIREYLSWDFRYSNTPACSATETS